MKHVNVRKFEPQMCDLCKTRVAEYSLAYIDPAKPGHEIPYGPAHRTVYAPLHSLKSCRNCVVDANYKLLVVAGLAPELPKEDGYVGTTG